MIKYLKVKFDKKNNTEESFWYLEIDLARHRVLREVEHRLNGKTRKAPTEEDNYGVFTDNLDVFIAPQKSSKKAIVFNLSNDDVVLIGKDEFENMWLRNV